MAEDIDTAERLARIETKLDNVLTIIPNHDTRIRDLELRKEECLQVVRIEKIESCIDEHGVRIDNLEKTRDKDSGARWASVSNRETILFFITIGLASLNVLQFAGGK